MEPLTSLPPALPPPKNLRRVGWVLVVIGAGLSAGMLFLSYYLHDIVTAPDTHARWTGTAAFTKTTFEMFGAIFVFGIVSMAAGAYQIRHNRRSPALVVVILITVAVIIYLGYGVSENSPTDEPKTLRTY